MSTDLKLNSIIDLFRRLPVSNLSSNLTAVLNLIQASDGDGELTELVLNSIDQPLTLMHDAAAGLDYLTCDYNRDGDSYRSPWSNTYEPMIDDGTKPSDRLRELEVQLNDAFNIYRELYYEGGTSSVYLWDTDQGQFAGVVLLKKTIDSNGTKSTWDSIHVLESLERGGRTVQYKLTSTIMLYMSNQKQISTTTTSSTTKSDVTLSGSMTRQNELEAPFDATNATSSHIVGIGRAIEDMEIKMRNTLQEVYFSKSKDIVDSLRSNKGYNLDSIQKGIQFELVQGLKSKSSASS